MDIIFLDDCEVIFCFLEILCLPPMSSKFMDSIHGCGAPVLCSTVPEEPNQIVQEGVIMVLISPPLSRSFHSISHGLSVSLDLLFTSSRLWVIPRLGRIRGQCRGGQTGESEPTQVPHSKPVSAPI